MFTFKPSSPRNSGNFPRKSAYHFPSTSRLRKMQMNETTLKPPLDASEAKLHHFNSPMVRKHPLPNHQVASLIYFNTKTLWETDNIADAWVRVGILSMTYHHPQMVMPIWARRCHKFSISFYQRFCENLEVPWVWDKQTQIEGKVVKPIKYITVWMLGWEILNHPILTVLQIFV